MDVDTMDIDATGFNQLSEEEKKKLMAKNACFYCQKSRHCANDCHKKKYDHAQAGGSRRNQHNAEVKTANLIDFSNVTMEQIADALQTETFLKMEDNEKLKIIEKIVPQGF